MQAYALAGKEELGKGRTMSSESFQYAFSGYLVLALVGSGGVVSAGGNHCSGTGCTEPCPAENACLSDLECPPNFTCEPGCLPSSCGCDAQGDTWTCTRDCIGECTPGPIVPTVSTWGLAALLLLGMTAGTMLFRARGIRSEGDQGNAPAL